MRFNAFRVRGRWWLAVCPLARAAEHVTLKNGFELDCVRREVVGDKVRLYFATRCGARAEDSNYMDVAADSVVRVETLPDVPEPVVAARRLRRSMRHVA